ncbi:hypothetical protein [Xanthobacter sediminis]
MAQGLMDYIPDYLRNSWDGLARGAKAVREATDPFQYARPAAQAAASMLPGAGLVQGSQDFQSGRQALGDGRYGDAAMDYGRGLLNAGTDMVPMLAALPPITMRGGGVRFLETAPASPVNANASPQEVRAMIPEPLSRQDRDWQNYGRFMSPDDVLGSEAVWGAASSGADRAQSFADAANDLWRRMGANRYMSPDMARRYMAVEEAKMRGIQPVGNRPGLMGFDPGRGPEVNEKLGQEPLGTLESRSAGLYNLPVKPPRPIEADYPAGVPADASGRITHDIEGRPLTARYVVGRNVVGQGEKALSPEELVAVTEGTVGAGPQAIAPKALGRAVGRAEFDRFSGKPLGLYFSNQLNEAQAGKVLAHEVGHVIDQTAGEIPTIGLSRELAPLYDTLNTGRERTSKFMGPQHLGYSAEEVPREHMAEAIRAYIADPNYIKTVAPKVAARIREYVNSNDKLKKIIQFNAMAGGGVLAYDRLLPDLED